MFTLKIKTDNAAFEDDMRFPEVARILRDAAIQIENAQREAGFVRDINGNTVGEWKFK